MDPSENAMLPPVTTIARSRSPTHTSSLSFPSSQGSMDTSDLTASTIDNFSSQERGRHVLAVGMGMMKSSLTNGRPC
ncbi:hypothetical protein BD779DRAFT_1231290 [Infundibulicybe gibba]|nr:hypothetical protein BD779DRAFT_1231290 [Infundibulicybe gibba]